MEFMPLHVLILVINPISIMAMFPILSLLWDRPLLAIPGATAAGLAAMEIYYLLAGMSVAPPGLLLRALLLLATCVFLWAVNAAAKRALIARRDHGSPTEAA